MNEKYTVMTPFDVTHKMLGPYLFSATARETLNEKVELYFHDPSFMPLFIQVEFMAPKATFQYLIPAHLSTGELSQDTAREAEK